MAYDPARAALAPARRASLLMFILGGFLALGGLCFGGMALALPAIPAAERAEFDKLEQEAMASAGVSFRTLVFVLAAVLSLPGLILLTQAFFVRRGGLAAVIGAIVVTLICTLVALLFLASGLWASAQGEMQMILGTLIMGLGLVALITLAAFLFQAAKAAPGIAAMRVYAQQLYWQHQQSAHYYAPPPPSGYVPAPPPPPPLAADADNIPPPT